MKKLILLTAFVVTTTSVCLAQASFGFQAGGNLAFGKVTNQYSDPLFPSSLTSKPKFGFLIGVIGEIPFGSKFAFRPELNFIQKGSKPSIFESFNGSNIEQDITLNYIELPLNVVFKANVGSGNFFFGLGPALAFGISGKDKISYPYDPSDPDLNRTAKVNFDGKKSDDITDPKDMDLHLKRFDVGANILAGYKLGNGLFFKLGYNYGFMNIDPNDGNKDAQDRSTYKNRGFNICIGYMLGGRSSNDD